MQQAPISFVEKYYIDDLAERNSAESQWSLKWLQEVSGTNVLSLGCGPNFYDDAQFFDGMPQEFVGIDLNEANIDFLKTSSHPELTRSKERLLAGGARVELRVGDILEEIPSFANRFDTVYAVGVLGMFNEEDTKRLFKNIRSYLKPGGKLLDLDWTDAYLSKDKLAERESYEWYSTRGPSVARIGELLEAEGLQVVRHEVHEVPDPEAYLWGKIYAYLALKTA